MTIKECYLMMDADYDDVISRLMNDRLVLKYNKKFAESDDYSNLVKAVENKDYPMAFRMAHNLKGISLNLGFSGLFTVSNELCDEIRDGDPQIDISPMLDAITVKYQQVIEGIKLMEE